MAKKKAVVDQVDWKTPKLKGKAICFAGRFEKYQWGVNRDWLAFHVLKEGGTVTEKLDAAVSFLVLKDVTGASSHENKVTLLNAKGASISVIDPEQLRQMITPSNAEVEAMLRAGPEGYQRVQDAMAMTEFRSDWIMYGHKPPYSVSNLNLRGQDLWPIPLWGVVIHDSDLRETKFRRRDRNESRPCLGGLVNCRLDGATLEANYGELVGCSCRNADLSGGSVSDYSQAKRCHADFTKAKLVKFRFGESICSDSNFTKADLTEAKFENGTAKNAIFQGACLKSIQGKEADFSGSDFTKADLSGAELINAKLDRCDLTGANLRGAVLTGASLKGACLKGADFTDANVGQVDFKGADVSQAKGLSAAPVRKIAVGPKLKELSDRIKQADDFRTTIDVETKAKPIRLVVRGSARWNRASWTKDLWADTLSDWEQNANSVADAFRAAVGCWPEGTPLPHTVTATGKKTGLVNAKLTRLAMEAWCETLGIAVPSADEMQNQEAGAEAKKDQERARLLALLDSPEGIKKWDNEERKNVYDMESFPKADLAGKQLDGWDSWKRNFERGNFESASLVEAQLCFASYKASNFRNAKLSRMKGTWGKFDECDFTNADLSNGYFDSASFLKAKFLGANLTDVNLWKAKLRGADFTGAQFSSERSSCENSFIGAEFDETTIFPADFELPKSMIWKGKDIDPRAKSAVQAIQSAGPIDLPQFMTLLEALVDKDRLAKALAMLKADRFRLFAQASDEQLVGVVKSQSDAELVYSCRLTKEGEFSCCTQNLNVCGGLRGALCKHLLVLIIGMTNGGELDPTVVNQWITASRFKKPVLNKDAMSETLLRYKGAEAGEVDWRPMETIPEDYYAL